MIAFSLSRLEKESIRLEGTEPPDFTQHQGLFQ